MLTPPVLDAEGYLDSVERCRREFPERHAHVRFRQAIRAIAGTGIALELNIGGPIRPWIPQWWREEGGRAITIASDAHTPDWLAGNFYEAMAMAEHFGFHPGRRPQDFWTL